MVWQKREHNSREARLSMLPEQIGDQPFCIYGAGIVAASVYTAIKALYHRTPLFFLVSDEEESIRNREPKEIDGIGVKSLAAWKKELQNNGFHMAVPDYFLIAVPEVHHASVIFSLQSIESLEIEAFRMILVTNALENALMEAYYGGLPDCSTVSDILSGEHWPDGIESRVKQAQEDRVQVFQAKCHKDRPLHNRKEGWGQVFPQYVYPIQAGAALTDQVVADLQDNRGDHISAKNGNYSELTATYYAWKNSRASYKGLCHYRRVFDIDDEQMGKLLERRKEWDVILPYPSIHYPDISTQHNRYIGEEDWKAMLQALKETEPDYAIAYQRFMERGEQYFFNFNMLIARAEVFDDYCSFLFRVLDRTEALVTPRGWERADRFAGYMGENLTTIYFHKNRDKLRIVYAGKAWLT